MCFRTLSLLEQPAFTERISYDNRLLFLALLATLVVQVEQSVGVCLCRRTIIFERNNLSVR